MPPPMAGLWQLQVIYHSPLAMLTSTLNPGRLVVGGTQGMRYIIPNNGPLASDSLSAVAINGGGVIDVTGQAANRKSAA